MAKRRNLPAPLQRLRPGYVPPEAVVSKARRGSDPLEEIERLAAKYEPAIAKSILAYLQTVKDGIDLNVLIEALKTGDINSVMAVLAAVDTTVARAAAIDALRNAAWGGAAYAASGINASITGVHFAFDRLNPRLISWLNSYTLELIRQIDAGTKEAIRDSLTQGMSAGAGPIDTARKVRGAIGLTRRQQAAVATYRKELETFHERSSAKGYNLGGKISRANGRQVFAIDDDGNPKDGIFERRLRDFRFDGQLQTAMDKKKPLTKAQIDKMVSAYERKYLKYRSETIARTESLRTTNFGVQDAWRQAIEQGKISEPLVRREWIVARDERLCQICAPIPKMNGKRGVKFDQPFATPKGPVMLPPIHPNCRCTVFIRQYEPVQLED
jgi:Phage Mu protein F like protein